MKTPYLDRQIEELEWTELNSVATQSHKDELKEFKAIKEALSIHDVSNICQCSSPVFKTYEYTNKPVCTKCRKI